MKQDLNSFEAYGIIRRAECFGWVAPADNTETLWEVVLRAQEFLYEKGIERRADSASAVTDTE